MLMNPMTFYVNEEIRTITELLEIAIDRELTMDTSEQADVSKWSIQFVDNIEDELSTEEIYIEDLDDLIEYYVDPIVEKFSIDKRPIEIIIDLQYINITDNQRKVLGKYYLNRKLSNQEHSIVSRLRKKLEKSKNMIKLHNLLKTDTSEFDENDWLIHINTLSEAEKKEFNRFWRSVNMQEIEYDRDTYEKAVIEGMSKQIEFVYNLWKERSV